MTKEELLKIWKDFQSSYQEQVMYDLKFDYNTPFLKIKKNAIVKALALWKFVQELTQEEKKEFLPLFVNHANVLIRIVAMAELLPVSVWRRILWKYNIDFMSFESFLRRLNVEQIEAINNNYLDLFVNNRVPGVIGMFTRWIKRITVEKLLSEPENSAKRYISKGAMSYNLPGLDFGFNAYPKGAADDTRVVEYGPLRFLSVKNHADDFIVNQENGKYWWLYRKARSNYVWKPKKRVQLKTHICPGFWYTLILHLLFWVISPLAFTGLVGNFLSEGTIGFFAVPALSFLFGLLALITPLWTAIAVIKLLEKLLFAGAGIVISEEKRKKMEEWFNKHEEKFNLAGIILMLLLSAGGLIYGAILVFKLLLPSFGILGSLLIIAAIAVYLGYGIHKKTDNEPWPSPKEFPFHFQAPILIIVGWILAKAHLLYGKLLWSLILFALNAIWSFILFMNWFLVVLIAPFAFIALTLYFSKFVNEEKKEKLFPYLVKGLEYISWGMLVILAVSIMVVILMAGGMSPFLLIALALSCIFFTVAWLVAFHHDPTVVEANDLTEKVNHYYLLYGRRKISYRLILKNKWLMSLDREGREKEVKRIMNILRDIVGTEKGYLYDLFSVITKEALDKLERFKKRLYDLGREYTTEDEYKLMVAKIIDKILAGYDFDEAYQLATKESEKEEKYFQKAKKALKVIFFPMTILIIVAPKIWEYLKTLYRLYKLFNERCPYVTQSRVITMKD